MAARRHRSRARGAARRHCSKAGAGGEGARAHRLRTGDDPRARGGDHDSDRRLESGRRRVRSAAARQRARAGEARSRARRQDRVPLSRAILGRREFRPCARPLHADVVDFRAIALADSHGLGGRPRGGRIARRAAGDDRSRARRDVPRLRRSPPPPRLAPRRHADARLAAGRPALLRRRGDEQRRDRNGLGSDRLGVARGAANYYIEEMNGRARVLLLCVLALAPAALARVLSYAPYTSRQSRSSIHYRGARWFALAETLTDDPITSSAQVVLYDAFNFEEPRVIYPSPTTGVPIAFVAVFQNRFATAGVGIDIPRILIGTYETASPFQAFYMLSTDGGKTFTRVKELDNAPAFTNFFEPDYGGPYSHGLSTGIIVGDTFPFVLSTSKGIVAIGIDGSVKTLASSDYTLLGRDAIGSRFLVRKGSEVSILAADGTLTPAGLVPPPLGPLNGRLTTDGRAYVQASFNTYRYLYQLRNQQRTLIAATYDASDPTTGILPNPGVSELSFFAVPTNDYDGAWMIQRRSGKPTTLLRHTQAAGVETFWSDGSGPQVEALHTAANPNLLLVQVHRPRAQQQWVFTDPALALWRVGEPAPRAYDELFLNEIATKTFVRLNVDLLAEGAPFVFDSGSQLSFNRCSPVDRQSVV